MTWDAIVRARKLRLALRNPASASQHAEKLKNDFDRSYSYLLDAEENFQSQARESFHKKIAPVVEKGAVKAMGSKIAKGGRKRLQEQVIASIKEEIFCQSIHELVGGSNMNHAFDDLFRSLYWSYCDLFSKLSESEEALSYEEPSRPAIVTKSPNPPIKPIESSENECKSAMQLTAVEDNLGAKESKDDTTTKQSEMESGKIDSKIEQM